VVLAGSQSDPVAVVGGQVWRLGASTTGIERLRDGQFVGVVQGRANGLVVRSETAS